ncbi:MAG TPA: hypothetical protein VER33_02275 [Polyangiaceae bacterium]|nr:hypothetical protein [Polyangiaceae bacterium]
MVVRPSARRYVRMRGAALIQYVLLVGLVGLALTAGMRLFGAQLSSKAEAQGMQVRGLGRTLPTEVATGADVSTTEASSAALSKPTTAANVTIRSVDAGSSTEASESPSLGLGSILLLLAAIIGVGAVVITVLMRARARAEHAGASS